MNPPTPPPEKRNVTLTERVKAKARELGADLVGIAPVERFACDWAARYCLAGEEGPKYCGLDVDVPLPKDRTTNAVASALGKINWGVQKRHTNIVEECLRPCPARGLGQQSRTGIPACH